MSTFRRLLADWTHCSDLHDEISKSTSWPPKGFSRDALGIAAEVMKRSSLQARLQPWKTTLSMLTELGNARVNMVHLKERAGMLHPAVLQWYIDPERKLISSQTDVL
jgi:hypothetical protein